MNDAIRDYIGEQAKSKKFGTLPFFYLYDTSDIGHKLDLLKKNALNNVSLYYAMKANPNSKILKFIKKHPAVKGVEIASSGELTKALKHFKHDQIIYTGPAKRPHELEQSVKNKIRFLSIESLTEAYRINGIVKAAGSGRQNILIRINPDYEIKNSLKKITGCSSKMGIDEDKIVCALEEIQRLPYCNILGFHVFAASGVLDYRDLLDYVEYIFGLVRKIERSLGKEFSIIDFGGGFGIDYSGSQAQFNLEGFFGGLKKLVEDWQYGDKELVLELGRYIMGESGYYVAEIVDIKESKGKKHIITSGGVNHIRLIRKHPIFVLPAHRAAVYNQQPSIAREHVEIEGPLCFGEDKIDADAYIAEARIGDLVVISHVGAYGYNVASREFLCHPKPYEVIKNFDCREHTSAECRN